MQDFLKKNFWIVNVVTVVVCAVFAAMAVDHWLEASLLGDSNKPAKPKVRKVQRPTKPTTTRSKLGEPLVTRNMFCSECSPPADDVPVDDGPVVDSDTPPTTSLPLKLIATNVADPEKHSFATVHNTSSAVVGAYRIGDPIPSAGPIVRIRGKYIDFENNVSKRVERLSFGDAPPPKTRPTRTRPTRDRGKKDDLTASLDDGIKKVSDTSYEIDRALVDKIIANPTAIRGARIVPSIKNGKPNGFKLYAIRPSSAFAKIGLQNGDTIHSINGFDLTTPDKALEVYTKVREANSLSVTITRRGKNVTMDYNIR